MNQPAKPRTQTLPVARLYLDDLQKIYEIVEKLGLGKPTISIWVTIPKLNKTSETSAFGATVESIGALRVYSNDGRECGEDRRIAQVIIRANTPKEATDYAWIEVILLDQRSGSWGARPGSDTSRVTIFPEQQEDLRQALYEIEATIASKARPPAPRWLVVLAVGVYMLAVVIIIPIVLEFLSVSHTIPAIYLAALYWILARTVVVRVASRYQHTNAIIPLQRDQEPRSFWEVQPGKAIVWIVVTILAAVLGWITLGVIGLLVR